MELVLESGADINKPGIICKSTTQHNVWTNAIGAAAFLGNADIITKLIKASPGTIDHPATESNAHGTVKQEFSGYTPVMLAAASNDKCLDCVKILLEAGANKTISDVFGDQIAHIAGLNKNNKILRYLIKEANLDLTHPNKRGETALQRCQTAEN